MLSIIIPTYNEAENIPILLQEIAAVGMTDPYEIIIVDDNSPDGTATVAKTYTNRYPLRVIVRETDRGLGAAVRAGFDAANGSYLAVMDADLSHDPTLLPEMLASLKQGTDIAIGTRFHTHSEVEGWHWFRKATSVCGVWCAKQLSGASDPLSGLFMIRRSVIAETSLDTKGYKILFEILVKGNWKHVVELPYTFRMRRHSTSKLNMKEYGRFFLQVARYWWYRRFLIK